MTLKKINMELSEISKFHSITKNFKSCELGNVEISTFSNSTNLKLHIKFYYFEFSENTLFQFVQLIKDVNTFIHENELNPLLLHDYVDSVDFKAFLIGFNEFVIFQLSNAYHISDLEVNKAKKIQSHYKEFLKFVFSDFNIPLISEPKINNELFNINSIREFERLEVYRTYFELIGDIE